MEVFALVGASGTGKSYHATALAMEREIDFIIDDGLLIYGNKVLEGISAKKEATKMGAVRRALFMDEGHAQAVIRAMEVHRPTKILLLGTSRNMVERIAQNLRLPPVKGYIPIEDIASPRDIRLAKKMRQEEGKHVIPVPTFEIKKDFSGYFIHPLRIFQKGRGLDTQISEKTVVRPTYSYLGHYSIADSAVESIAVYNCSKVEGISKVWNVTITTGKEGIVLAMDVSLIYGRKIMDVLQEAQRLIVQDIEELTGINVLMMNITARSLVMK